MIKGRESASGEWEGDRVEELFLSAGGAGEEFIEITEEEAAAPEESIAQSLEAISKVELVDDAPLEPVERAVLYNGEEESSDLENEPGECFAELHRLRRQVLELKTELREADQYYKKFVQVSADLENTRKRIARMKKEFLREGMRVLLGDLLVVLDNFDLARSNINDGSNLSSIQDGVELICKQFELVLRKQGLTRIDKVGVRFDPAIHEAVCYIPSDVYEANTVIEVIRRGFQYEDQVLRAAMVSVSAGRVMKSDSQLSSSALSSEEVDSSDEAEETKRESNT